MRQQGDGKKRKKKESFTPSGLEPSTFQFVT
jgi:hypothetical protein